ncbi:MAG: peptide deformylase [Myxococcales bacterium]|nr:peptide deformylase [Myxococcales bacterium]
MARLTVLTWPDEALRIVAKPVDYFDQGLAQLVDDLFETMYAEKGVGLAATQVGVDRRLLVVDCGQDEREPYALINPELESYEGELIWPEGCLSIPGVRADVTRHAHIVVRYKDHSGLDHKLSANGLLAVCLQHEIDHLDGKMYFDRLGMLERRSVLNAYRDYLDTKDDEKDDDV